VRSLLQQIEELCDVLQLLSQPAADGPCWCDVAAGGAALTNHTAKCQRARMALSSGRLYREGQTEPAPGYGHGV
jgi:hypothetical protein